MNAYGCGTFRLLRSLCLIPLFAQIAVAALPERGFVNRVYRNEAGEHKYVVFVPQGYTEEKSWPTILFLHGAGERGSDGKAQVTVGLGRAIQARHETFPFLAVFPQCKDRSVPARRGWLPETADGKRALAILAEVEKVYRVDKDRVYLTGLSMGGFGTWAHAAADPERWAAIAPVCGGGDPSTATKLVNLPTWAFHGAEDRVVPADESRRMITAIEQAGGKPRYTEFAGVQHNSWDSAYATDELYTWMLSHKRSERPNRANVANQLRLVANRTWTESGNPQEVPFIPALEIPDAVYVRLGNEMLGALADSLPTVMPADALTGVIADVQRTTADQGMTVHTRFCGITYSGRVSRVLMQAQGEDRVNVTVALRDVNLVFSRIYLRGEFFSADCGPMRIVLGHRAELPLSFQVRPDVEQGKLRLRLLGTQFRLTPGNWAVGRPAWVNMSGLLGRLVGEGRIVQGLQDGIYRDSNRIEREVAGTVPRMLARLESRFTIEPTEQIVAGMWPLPVYKPSLRTWPTFIRTDSTGITIGLGVVAAAYDARTAPAQAKRVDLPESGTLRSVTGEQFQIAVAPGLMGPLSEQVVADDAARAHVVDMPMQKLQPLGDAVALSEIVPDLKQRGDREVRAEIRLLSPLRLHRDQTAPANTILFELPKVRCEIAVHPDAASQDWMPYLEIDFSLRQAARPEVTSPTPASRVLALGWQGDAAIDVQAKFASGYSPRDSKIDTNRIREILLAAWQEWTSTGSMAQVNLEDLDLGFSKLRADRVDWVGPHLAATYGPAGLTIRNTTNQPMSYEMKGPYSAWGGPYTIEPGQLHEFAVSYPVTCRFQVDGAGKVYTLPPGLRFDFQLDEATGLPDLFTSQEAAAAGAVSLAPAVHPAESLPDAPAAATSAFRESAQFGYLPSLQP
jgi:poly(3-hydroxybutyrate) depolymerase